MLKNIFMGCMPFGFTKADIEQQCGPYGKVQSIELFQDLEHATFDSYAHIAIDTEDVHRLITELDGKVIGNRPLRVNEKVTRTDTLKRLEETLPSTKNEEPRRATVLQS